MKLPESAKAKRQEIINEIPNFPSIPTAAVQARELLQDPEVDFDKLAEIIRVDQALTANLLRIANTIAFSGRRRVDTVDQAIVRLGTRHVSQMIIGLSAAPLMKKEVQGYDLGPQELWKHALAVGIGAEQLAQQKDLEVPDIAFTAGLLHNIGKVALGTFLDADVEKIRAVAFKKEVSFHLAERVVLGIDHAELGSLLLEDWGLSDKLISVARWHHEPDEMPGEHKIVDLVHIADAVAKQAGIGAGTDGLHYGLSDNAIDRLGVTRDDIDQVLLEVESEIEEISELFAD